MINLMLISKQDNIIAGLSQLLAADDDIEIAAVASGGDSALEKIENIAPDVVLINSDASDTDVLNLAERIILRKPRSYVILMLSEMTADSLKAASDTGCHNIISFPKDSKEFCDYIHRVYNTENTKIAALTSKERVTWTSKVITVFGAKGGLGKTTIATNLAIKLAELGRKVAIVDLDLQFGDVHIFMDADPKETISDLMQEMYQPNIDTVRSYMCIHPSGVHILCAPKSPEYADLVSPDSIQSLLGLLRSYYDYVIIDTTSSFTEVILSAIEASSMVLFVTGLDVSILKNSKVAMNILESLGQKKKVRAIINRAVEINSITIADVQRIVDAPILARFPSDYMVAVAALNQGQPFVQSAPKSKLSMAVADMALKIDSGRDNFDIQQLKPKERRALLNKYKTKDKSEKRSLFRRKRA